MQFEIHTDSHQLVPELHIDLVSFGLVPMVQRFHGLEMCYTLTIVNIPSLFYNN